MKAFKDQDGNNLAGVYLAGATVSAAYTATAGRSGADFTAGVKFVRLFSTTTCFYKFGSASVDATTSDTPLLANVERIVPIPHGSARISAIRLASDGTLYVTELP